MHEVVASFIGTEGHAGVEILIDAIQLRRYGSRELSLNCFAVIIDADAQTVWFINLLDREAGDVTIPTDQVLAELRS